MFAIYLFTTRPPPPRPPHTLLPSPHLQHHGDDIEAIENDGWDYLKVAAAIVTCGFANIAAFLAAKGKPFGRKAPADQPFSFLRVAVSWAQGKKGFWVHPTSGRTSEGKVRSVLFRAPDFPSLTSICLVQCCLCGAVWDSHHLQLQYFDGRVTLTPGRCVHKYIDSGFTEYDHLMVVAMALEMVGGRQALVGGKVPQQQLSKCKAAYGTVNFGDMTSEVRASYDRDNDKRKVATFEDMHCGKKVNAYYTYIMKTPKDQQREPKCKCCTLKFQMRIGGRPQERVHHQHKWE